ncbi:hypothetical protein [Roseibium sp. Sym1]|uniref:hypothetical protein n=1 Tax=Roseibium sp. Sym1 TaxID=3016006 RepID=UPI0022B3A606|nr:hypothetical protein [Roseibium sp. Sym1]
MSKLKKRNPFTTIDRKGQTLRRFFFISSALLATFLVSACQTNEGSGEVTYSDLKAKGYKTGKLGASRENPRGGVGWYVSGNGERYWCVPSVTTVRIGADRFGVFRLANGQVYEVDEQQFAKSLRRDTSDSPQLSDIKAGRPRSQDISFCHKV